MGEYKEVELLSVRKDGGPESRVWIYLPVAIKRLFTIALLRFEDGSRDAYHSHAFHCLSWVLYGALIERHIDGRIVYHPASWRPFVTRREDYHKVTSLGRSWVFSLRGPWAKTWNEFVDGQHRTLTWGRKVVQ